MTDLNPYEELGVERTADEPAIVEEHATKHHRPIPVYAGDIDRKCSNCQHFEPYSARPRDGLCRNGISGNLVTRLIDGCAYGFYPSIKKFPLKPGPGGSR